MALAALEPLVGRPTDPVVLLEQRVELLEDENRSLLGKLSSAYRRIAELEGCDPQLALDDLISQLRSSEAQRQQQAKAQAEERAAAKAKAESEKREKKPQRGHGPRPQADLPVVKEVVELAPSDRQCGVCGGEMVPLGEQFEESEDIHVIERQYVKRQIQRRKYRCRCNSCVVTAPGAPRVLPGGRYSNDFILQVVADKYLDHVPLERQVRIMERHGVEIASQTLFDQAWALAQLHLPAYEQLGKRVLRAPVLHADETRWPLLSPSEKPSHGTVWTRTTSDIAHYAILRSKSTSAARVLFDDYRGTIVVDGYAVYERLARDGPNLKLANCWAHVLRKFKVIQGNFPQACEGVLTLIGQLYKIEAQVAGPFPGDRAAQQRRLDLRGEHSQPLLTEIRKWACTEVGLPRSALGLAVRYMLKRWQALTRFVTDPLIPLDNNAAERSLRGLVIGRKVHYGSKSKRGTQVAAIFYTLFETAKLCGVEPVAYLRLATQAALESPAKVILPHDLISIPPSHEN